MTASKCSPRGHTWGPLNFDGYHYCRCGARIRSGLDMPPVTVRWRR